MATTKTLYIAAIPDYHNSRHLTLEGALRTLDLAREDLTNMGIDYCGAHIAKYDYCGPRTRTQVVWPFEGTVYTS
jgi:hypothetical protein